MGPPSGTNRPRRCIASGSAVSSTRIPSDPTVAQRRDPTRRRAWAGSSYLPSTVPSSSSSSPRVPVPSATTARFPSTSKADLHVRHVGERIGYRYVPCVTVVVASANGEADFLGIGRIGYVDDAMSAINGGHVREIVVHGDSGHLVFGGEPSYRHRPGRVRSGAPRNTNEPVRGEIRQPSSNIYIREGESVLPGFRFWFISTARLMASPSSSRQVVLPWPIAPTRSRSSGGPWRTSAPPWSRSPRARTVCRCSARG